LTRTEQQRQIRRQGVGGDDHARRALIVLGGGQARCGTALAVWSIRKFVRTARRYRTIESQVGPRTITAADPLPEDLRHALEAINHPS
jgi:uncharacterized protein (DUF1501 family)